MTVCLSHGGQTLYRTEGPSNETFVGTVEGLVGLARSGPGARWEVARRALEGKHVSALMVEPTRGAIFAGTHRDGIYASLDGGRTWERRDRGVEFANIYCVNYSQVDGEVRLYAGTEPAHLYVSTNLGESWRELPSVRSAPSIDKWTFPAPPHEAHVKNLAFDPGTANTIYAGIEVGGALKSQDAGQTWQELSGFYEDVHRIVVPPMNPNRVYISGGDGIFHSQDAGETWEHITDRSYRIAYPDALIAHPEREGLLFTAGAICSPGQWRQQGTADPRIARSRDGGRSWELLERGLPEHIHGNIEAMSMNVWPGGFSLCAGTTDGDVFSSGDEGETWSTIASGLAPVSKGGHYRNVPPPGEAQLAGAR